MLFVVLVYLSVYYEKHYSTSYKWIAKECMEESSLVKGTSDYFFSGDLDHDPAFSEICTHFTLPISCSIF